MHASRPCFYGGRLRVKHFNTDEDTVEKTYSLVCRYWDFANIIVFMQYSRRWQCTSTESSSSALSVEHNHKVIRQSISKCWQNIRKIAAIAVGEIQVIILGICFFS